MTLKDLADSFSGVSRFNIRYVDPVGNESNYSIMLNKVAVLRNPCLSKKQVKRFTKDSYTPDTLFVSIFT